MVKFMSSLAEKLCTCIVTSCAVQELNHLIHWRRGSMPWSDDDQISWINGQTLLSSKSQLKKKSQTDLTDFVLLCDFKKNGWGGGGCVVVWFSLFSLHTTLPWRLYWCRLTHPNDLLSSVWRVASKQDVTFPMLSGKHWIPGSRGYHLLNLLSDNDRGIILTVDKYKSVAPRL